MSPRNVQEWLDAYGTAWRSRDAEAAAALFTEDSIYRSHPFRTPHRGQDGVRAYWTQATADQRGLDLRFGVPIAEGNRVAVEWWAVMRVVSPEGESAGSGVEGTAGSRIRESIGTLPGCLFLTFAPDGRCRELREYWHWKDQEITPPEGWGL
ncbi:MAG TPA: nuclear transport factor 2 family protein [Candidatus Eisenbacteria bacterium]|nr:nuclear transport factor 2 family protein [Candidatus Eisenbacteria bacterium]